jgi:hypothetical protein
VSHRKQIFSGGLYPFPKFLAGIFDGNRKSRITFERREIDEEFQLQTKANRIKESNGDVTSGPACRLAAEIDIPPLLAIGKRLIALKRYKID